MGIFESFEDVEYAAEGRDEFQECTFCAGKGYREFPVPLLSPSYDACPHGCDEMDDDTPMPGIVTWSKGDWAALKANQVKETEIRDREIARLQTAVRTVKYGPRSRKVDYLTLCRKPVAKARWIGNTKTGFWYYRRTQ